MRNSTQEPGRARRTRTGNDRDAIALLKADHRQVERWFAQFGKARKAERKAMRPGDEYYDAKVKVLSEMIKHHVKEEEKPGGLFAEARKSELDLGDLGRRMAARRLDG